MGLAQLPARMLIDGDWNFLYKCAVALYQLKRYLICGGRNLTIYCKGEWSLRIVEMLKKLDNRVPFFLIINVFILFYVKNF